MLIPQEARSGAHGRQGGRRASLAELRRHMAEPSTMDDGHRQRLLELARRLARVQALGDEYSRVTLSEHAAAALPDGAVVT